MRETGDMSGMGSYFAVLRVLAASVLLTSSIWSQTTPLGVAWELSTAKASVTHSATDIGSISDVFDGDVETLARTAAVNPMVVRLVFDSPQRLARSRVYYSAGPHRWRVEVADSAADMTQGVGSYRVALDWATGEGNVWRDQSFGSVAAARVVRLSLQRVQGDDYVHLYEWQLFTEDRPFEVTEVDGLESGVSLTWNAVAGRWYAIQASGDLRNWKDVGFHRAAGDSVTESVPVAETGSFLRVREAAPEDRRSITKRVLVLNVDPIIESRNGRRLNAVMGWSNSRTLNAAYLSDLSEASGGYVQWEVAHWLDLDHWPVKIDGFAYDDASFLQAWATRQFHDPDSVDYDALLDLRHASLGGRSAHEVAAAGEVDEVVCWAFPYSGFFESRMVGRGAYFCNAPGLERPSRLYVVMGLNPERGVAEALHSFGHRMESILWHVYGSWSGTSAVNHLWDRFTRIGPRHPGATAACGNIHFPPNANADYDYGNSLVVASEADDWLNFPILTGTTKPVGATSWGGPDHHRQFLRWWFSRLPKAAGRYTDPANATNQGKLNNWWAYGVDMNEYPESQ